MRHRYRLLVAAVLVAAVLVAAVLVGGLLVGGRAGQRPWPACPATPPLPSQARLSLSSKATRT